MADDEKQAGKKDHAEVFVLRKKEEKRPRGHLDFGVAFSVMKRKSVADEKKPPSTMSDIQPQGGKKTV